MMASAAVAADETMISDEDESADVNQSGEVEDDGERRGVRRSHGTDGRRRRGRGEGEEEEGEGARTTDGGRRSQSCSSNQITDSGGYTEIEIEDGEESSHHKRIIDPEFNTNHKDLEEERESEMLSSEANDDAADAAKVAASLTATTLTTASTSASVSVVESSCVTFVRRDDGEEGIDDRKGMIRVMDQTVCRLSVPSKVSGSSGVGGGRKSSSGTTSSSASLLSPPLLHPDPFRNQSNLGNNLLPILQPERSSNKRAIHAGDPEAGPRGGAAATRTAASTSGTTTGVSNRSKLKVEYSSASSGPTIDPVSTGTNAGSASVAQVWEEKQRISLSRERKAARVLGIVMGSYIHTYFTS